MYDVKKEYKKEELKEDLIRKNFGNVSDSEFEEMTKKNKFRPQL